MYYPPQQQQQMYPQYMYPQMPPNYMHYQQPMYFMSPQSQQSQQSQPPPQLMYQQYYQQQQQQQQLQHQPPQSPSQQSQPLSTQQSRSITIKTQQQPKTKETMCKLPKMPMEFQQPQVKCLPKSQIDDKVKDIIHVGFCHYCNTHGKICYYCFSDYNASECKHGFCFDCLSFKFKINPIKIILKHDWHCPAKSRQCNCCRCVTNSYIDSDALQSIDSVESYNKYTKLIDNTKKIKKQYAKKKNTIRDLYSAKFQQWDFRKKKQQQGSIQKKPLINTKLKRQLQFCGDSILKLRQMKQTLSPGDEQILHQVIRYNFGQILEQFQE